MLSGRKDNILTMPGISHKNPGCGFEKRCRLPSPGCVVVRANLYRDYIVEILIYCMYRLPRRWCPSLAAPAIFKTVSNGGDIPMSFYRLWYIRRGVNIQGPFPEALICRFILLGRIGEQDEVSLDGKYWRKADDVPELAEGVKNLLGTADKTVDTDPEWSEERARAALRWLDDRKLPDPRAKDMQQAIAAGVEKRKGSERRQNPETVEQHVYREGRGEFESWLRQQRQRYGMAVVFVSLAALIVALFTLFSQPVNPVKVGLIFQVRNCETAPSKGVNWSDCVKDDALLVGADLRGAELIGSSLKRANLSYADLTRANLAQADLTGANLTAARLGDAIWIDGRICAADSVGRCN